jgi:lipopolysaccharide transport protein LptA
MILGSEMTGVVVAALLCSVVAISSFASDHTEVELPRTAFKYIASYDELDLRDDTSTSDNIKFSMGAWFLVADKAKMKWIDQNNGECHLQGAVRFSGPEDSEIIADEATIEVRAKQIVSIRFFGRPTTFRRALSDAKGVVRGRADTVEYSMNKLINLVGDAHASSEKAQIDNESIIYDMIDEKLIMHNPPQSKNRVTFVVDPSKNPVKSP